MNNVGRGSIYNPIKMWLNNRAIGNFITVAVIEATDIFIFEIVFEISGKNNLVSKTRAFISQKEIYENRDNLDSFIDTFMMDVFVNWLLIDK